VDKDLTWWKSGIHRLAAYTRPITDRFTYRTRSGMAKGLKRSGGYGFLPRKLSDEERFFLSLDLAGKVFYDVGSFEGIVSLFAANAIGPNGCLMVFEPNPESYRRTQRNLELNSFQWRVTLQNVALGARRCSATMTCPGKEPARATLSNSIAQKFIRDGEKTAEFQVRVETLDDVIATGLPIPQFIKIDTEGYEYDVLRGAEQTLRYYGPDLFIEMHGATRDEWIQNRSLVQRMLTNCGYSVYDMYRTPISESDSASHLYCRNLTLQKATTVFVNSEDIQSCESLVTH
jgi:FkbM family methyltransferase